MKSCVPHQTDTLVGSYLFEPTCLFDETLPRLFILPVFPFLNNKNSPHTAYHFIFVRLFCKLSSSGSSDPYHFGGTRSVLSWETIVHYPRYKLRGQIRLKDTTLSLGSDLFFNYCLLQVCFLQIFYVSNFKRTRELQKVCMLCSNIIHEKNKTKQSLIRLSSRMRSHMRVRRLHRTCT